MKLLLLLLLFQVSSGAVTHCFYLCHNPWTLYLGKISIHLSICWKKERSCCLLFDGFVGCCRTMWHNSKCSNSHLVATCSNLNASNFRKCRYLFVCIFYNEGEYITKYNRMRCEGVYRNIGKLRELKNRIMV